MLNNKQAYESNDEEEIHDEVEEEVSVEGHLKNV